MANSLALDKNGVLWYFDVSGFGSNLPWYGFEQGPGEPFKSSAQWPGAGVLQGPVKGIVNQYGHLEVFALSGSGDLMHIWQSGPTASDWSWSSWESLGGGPLAGFDVVLDSGGSVVVVAVASYGYLCRLQQNSSGGWMDWELMSFPYQFRDGAPVLSANEDGRLQLFAIYAGTGYVASACQVSPGADSWSEVFELINPTDSPVTGHLTVAVNQDKRLEIFAASALNPGELLHAWQNEINGSWSSSWSSMGMAFDRAPAVADLGDGRLQMLALRAGELYSNVQDPSVEGGWAGWNPFSPTADTELDSVQLAANADGSLVAVCCGAGAYDIVSQTAPAGGWGQWYSPWRVEWLQQ